MCGGGKEEASADASNEVQVEAEVEGDDEEEGWKRRGSATVTAGDEEAAGGAEGGLTCEWDGVGGMSAVEGVWTAWTLRCTCEDSREGSPTHRLISKV